MCVSAVGVCVCVQVCFSSTVCPCKILKSVLCHSIFHDFHLNITNHHWATRAQHMCLFGTSPTCEASKTGEHGVWDREEISWTKPAMDVGSTVEPWVLNLLNPPVGHWARVMLGTVGTYAMGFSHGSDKSKKLQYTALRTPSNSTNETNCPRLKEHPQFKNETNANNPFGTNGMFRSHTEPRKVQMEMDQKKIFRICKSTNHWNLEVFFHGPVDTSVFVGPGRWFFGYFQWSSWRNHWSHRAL